MENRGIFALPNSITLPFRRVITTVITQRWRSPFKINQPVGGSNNHKANAIIPKFPEKQEEACMFVILSPSGIFGGGYSAFPGSSFRFYTRTKFTGA